MVLRLARFANVFASRRQTSIRENSIVKKLIYPAVLLVFAFVGRSFGQSQTPPVACVSIASFQKIIDDISSLGSYVGQPNAGMMVEGFVPIFTGGTLPANLAKDKAIGAVVTMNPQNTGYVGYGFLPIPEMAKVVEGLAALGVAKSDAAGGAVQLTGRGGKPLFAKQQAAWTFVAPQSEHLAALPAEPEALLGGLNTQYDIGMRVNMQSIRPQERQFALAAIKQGMAANQARTAGADPDVAAMQERMQATQMKQIEQFINELDQMNVGLAVDPSSHNLVSELTVSAVAGTKMANTATQYASTKPILAGYALPDAAGSIVYAAPLGPEDIEINLQSMSSVKELLLKKIAQLPANAPQPLILSCVQDLCKVIEETLRSGRIDLGGAILFPNNQPVLIASANVADAAKVEEVIKRLIDFGKAMPNFPAVADGGTAGDAHFMKLTVPVPDPDAQRVLGPTMDIHIGFSPKTVHISVGNDQLASLKQSFANTAPVETPVRIALSAKKILQFASAVAPMGQQMIAPVLDGAPDNDKWLITLKGINNGLVMHSEIESGVLSIIGKAVQMAQQQAQAQFGAPPGGQPAPAPPAPVNGTGTLTVPPAR
jgi:hypothetical protein